MDYIKNYRGSSWAKWDLHVHTPESYNQSFKAIDKDDVWEQYISDLENLPSEFKVIGINDYVLIDGYKKVLEYKRDGRLPNLEVILPVMEFRIKKFAGKKDLKKINFHVIFSDTVEPEIIEQQFLNALSSKYHLSPEVNNKGIKWSGVISKRSLEDFGKAIKASVPQEELPHFDSDFKEGITNLNIDEEDIINILQKSTYFINKHLFAIGKTEWADMSWVDGTIAEKKDIINKVDFIFSASESVKSYEKAKKILTEQKVNNRLLDCSDAHHNLTAEHKDRIGNCFTWIKADRCFEGLKQIIHEPDTRLLVSEATPFEPPRKINSITLNFPDETFIASGESKTSQQTIFCWSGAKKINFSPYFNCIIGGRGAGKSALLNLIAQKVGLENRFFSDNVLKIAESTKIIPENNIEIDGTGEIEFISQNEIDKFAENSTRLTDAIYSRIKQITNENFDLIEQDINTRIKEIEYVVKNKKALDDRQKRLKRANADLDDLNKIINAYRSDKYQEITERIADLEKKIRAHDTCRNNYVNLREDLNGTVTKYMSMLPSKDRNPFDNAIRTALDVISGTLATLPEASEIKTDVTDLSDSLNNFKTGLAEYLDNMGVGEENKKDYERAISQIPLLDQQIKTLNQEIKVLKEQIDSFTDTIIRTFA